MYYIWHNDCIEIDFDFKKLINALYTNLYILEKNKKFQSL